MILSCLYLFIYFIINEQWPKICDLDCWASTQKKKKKGLFQSLQKRWDSPKKRQNRPKMPIQCFKPPYNDSQYRVVEPILALFKSVEIVPSTFQTLFWHFYLCWDSLDQQLWRLILANFKAYTGILKIFFLKKVSI